ncbi:hypothetical protein [Streptomyces sp. B21-083]|uniref:hypothetical protein n=1 Tax=Streptomyces sp. B21-083 TaxID=3039410 RepID=UPI002FF12C29
MTATTNSASLYAPTRPYAMPHRENHPHTHPPHVHPRPGGTGPDARPAGTGRGHGPPELS